MNDTERNILLAALIGVFIFMTRKKIATGIETGISTVVKLTRGIRNNNPGNIRHSSAQWVGKAANQTDNSFVSFTDAVYGLRALAVTLRTYFTKYGLNTVRGIINRWAPPSENDTGAYVNAVAKAVGVSPDAPLSFARDVPLLIAAIVKHENGTQPYSSDTIAKAISLI